jgi:membrane-associated phospholipid phosphatase
MDMPGKLVWRFLFLIILLLVLSPEIMYCQNMDVDILKAINPDHPDSLYWLRTSSSVYWLPVVLLIAILVLELIVKNKQAKYRIVELLISIGASQLISEILKRTVNRERPADKYPYEIFVSSITHGSSFPSGHTSAAFAIAMTFALIFKKWYIVVPAWFWACTIAYSRMYLGKHYPSDVLMGIVIGIGSAFFSQWLTIKLFKDKNKIYVHP